MARRISESGFTLLEVLVASMLMAMLITILTMVFSSSSIAWSTGRAGVAEMDQLRSKMSAAGLAADNAVPRVDVNDSWGLLVSPWKGDELRRRAVVPVSGNSAASVGWKELTPPSVGSGSGKWVYRSGAQLWATASPEDIKISGDAKAFIVGVWSYGPDREPDTGDDICTWPDID